MVLHREFFYKVSIILSVFCWYVLQSSVITCIRIRNCIIASVISLFSESILRLQWGQNDASLSVFIGLKIIFTKMKIPGREPPGKYN